MRERESARAREREREREREARGLFCPLFFDFSQMGPLFFSFRHDAFVLMVEMGGAAAADAREGEGGGKLGKRGGRSATE